MVHITTKEVVGQLDDGTTYRYWTFESGTLGVASGAQLMGTGLDLDASIVTAPIVILEPQ